MELIMVIIGATGLLLLILLLTTVLRKKDGAADLRMEVSKQFNILSKTMLDAVGSINEGNNTTSELLRKNVEEKLREIQLSVSERLDTTLKTGLDSSFRRVNDQLNAVYQSMGEVRALTSGIGDLKNILANVKTRGIWGEVQLGKLLADFMAPGQYIENARIDGTNTVEFAVRIPREDEEPLLLPIDSKFPMDRYARMLKYVEKGDPEKLKAAQKDLVAAVLAEAKKINEKYIRPPKTTDFAILFLPSEGLYVEMIRLDMLEHIQGKWRVMVAGPSTLSALLTSFQTGFKVFELKQHSVAILDMLNAIKRDFEKYACEIKRTQNTLASAQNHLDTLQRGTSRIQSKLKTVEHLES
ncbi:DNA recombination protein RmuC [Christensenellaceae bacterium OttesenSCG-928-K19]|nr:DNA recombination protein RmuC [Christensenellaceae bacterium OttesenSCG-928-K19]